MEKWVLLVTQPQTIPEKKGGGGGVVNKISMGSYQRNSMWNFPGVNLTVKNDVEFPRMATKKK